MSEVRIKRGFVDVPDGQLHYRVCGPEAGTPLVMFHSSPGSSKGMEPLMRLMGGNRRLYAFDTLGNGDSSPAGMPQPDIVYLANAAAAAIDGLGLTALDLYGTHTGASIAVELAIARPRQVRKVILNGTTLFSPAERAEYLASYAPAVAIQPYGQHLIWAWNMVRDVNLFWPYYKRGRENRRDTGAPPADALHDAAVEVIKAIRTYHLSYRAAFAYVAEDRLPLLTATTLAACSPIDPLAEYLDGVARLIPNSRKLLLPEDPAATARLFEQFLDE